LYFDNNIAFKFSEEVTRVLGHAYFSALNRKGDEINIEDLLVGIYAALGDASQAFFEEPENLKTMVGQISGRHTQHFDLSHFPVEGKGSVERDAQGREIGHEGPVLYPADQVREIMADAERLSRSGSEKNTQVRLPDLMTALARSHFAAALLQEHNIHFKTI
jgi:hypothetical protein